MYTVLIARSDSLASVQEKMKACRGEPILLVLPNNRISFRSQLDLQRLHRFAAGLGAPFALVATDRTSRYYAEQLGIPIFRSMRAAKRAAWKNASVKDAIPQPQELAAQRPHPLPSRRPTLLQKKNPAPLPPALRWGSLAAGILAVMAVLAVLLPSATIHLQPAEMPQELTLELIAGTDISGYTLSGVVGAEAREITVEGRLSLPVSGSMSIPENKASGEVVFTNLTAETLSIPAGTLIRTPNQPNVRFLTTEGVELPDSAGTSATARVEAASPGEGGNLPAYSLTLLEGDLTFQAAVTNPTPLSGGTSVTATAPGEQDYETVRSQLLESLAANALSEAAGEEGAELVLTAQPELVEVLEEIYAPAEIAPAENLALTLRVVYRLEVIPQAVLEEMLGEILDATLPAGYAGVENSLVLLSMEDPQLDEEGHYHLLVYASRVLRGEVNPDLIPILVTGKSKTEAAALLEESLALAAPPEIVTRPGLFQRLPLLPARIHVVEGE